MYYWLKATSESLTRKEGPAELNKHYYYYYYYYYYYITVVS